MVAPLVRRLRPQTAGPEFVHVGIVGHKGTGKTTQVRKAMTDLQLLGVHPVFVDALTSFDQADLSFADLLLVISRAVLAALEDACVTVPTDRMELLNLWFAEELLTETHRNQILGTLETKAEVKGGVPFLAKVMAKVTGVLKTDNEYRREIRRRAARDPAELMVRTNGLLDAATQALSSTLEEKKKLVVVVDNLEKLTDRTQVDAAVLRRADDLRQLRCHLVLFFDPADQYAPATVQAGQAFDVVTVPMLPIREHHDLADHVAAPALEAIFDLLDRRMDLEKLFADPKECIRAVARYSGGRLRDVFHLTRLACELADPNKITEDHIDSAARKLKGERLSLAKPEHWPRLAAIHRDKQIANDPNDAHLLLHSLVLNYDGEPWWDVHPLVRLDERFDAAWKSLAKVSAV